MAERRSKSDAGSQRHTKKRWTARSITKGLSLITEGRNKTKKHGREGAGGAQEKRREDRIHMREKHFNL